MERRAVMMEIKNKKNKKEEQGFMSSVKVGAKGQIVIPNEIRNMFGIEPGETLVIFAHPERGIALQKQNIMIKIADTIFRGKGKELYPDEADNNLNEFADKIKKVSSKDITD